MWLVRPGEEVGALPADEQLFASSAWGSPVAASCWLREVPGLWRLHGRSASPCVPVWPRVTKGQ